MVTISRDFHQLESCRRACRNSKHLVTSHSRVSEMCGTTVSQIENFYLGMYKNLALLPWKLLRTFLRQMCGPRELLWLSVVISPTREKIFHFLTFFYPAILSLSVLSWPTSPLEDRLPSCRCRGSYPKILVWWMGQILCLPLVEHQVFCTA